MVDLLRLFAEYGLTAAGDEYIPEVGEGDARLMLAEDASDARAA